MNQSTNGIDEDVIICNTATIDASSKAQQQSSYIEAFPFTSVLSPYSLLKGFVVMLNMMNHGSEK